jgi:hypothetical protein
MSAPTDIELEAIEAERRRIRAEYLCEDRPPSSARGVHHVALLSSNVERTVRFYQGLLEFPLTEIIENRDYPGSNHFFFDLGHGTLPPRSPQRGLGVLSRPRRARIELLADPLGEMYGTKVL